jgi:hypothetical protein
MPGTERLLYPADDWLFLLRACLVSGAQGEKAWNEWQAAAGGPAALLSGQWAAAKRWWPLLWTALRRNRLDVAHDISMPLKSACAAETVRYSRCRHIASSVVSVLTGSGFEPVLLKGMALAETVYEHPFLRHCHGIDVWIRTGDPQRAAAELAPAFHPDPGNDARPGSPARFSHGSGLPLQLRGKAFEDECLPAATPVVRGDGLLCDMLPREYALCQACREAGREEDFPFAWISDGWHLLRSPGSLDREQLSSIVSRSDTAGVLRERLEYLHDVFATCLAR